MQLFFAGGESNAHLDTLRSCGVTRVAVSIANLARHTRDYAVWAAKQPLAGFDWVVYADSPSTPVAPLLELLAGSPSEPDGVAGPVEWATETWLNDSDILFLPMWDGHDASVLRNMVELYDGTVLPDAVVDNPAAVRTAKACMGRMSTLGALTGRSKGIDKFDLLVSSAWYAVQKHGETQVWTGNRMVRMNSDDKHLKRQRYAAAIEALGVDVSSVLADDPKETARLAILSWLAMEKFVNAGHQMAQDRLPVVASGPHNQSPSNGSADHGVDSVVAQTRHQSITALPVLAFQSITETRQDADGNPVVDTINVIASNSESVRQCDTCALSAACPGYQAAAKCSFNIPVVIRTKDQRQAVLRTLVEIQTQRILMGSFAEQVLGEPNDQVGKEMDRLFTMVEKWKTIEEQTTKLHIGIEASGPDADGNMGMISALFGSQAGQNARKLDIPMLSDEIIEEADLVGEAAD
jgi:hypothetical protein